MSNTPLQLPEWKEQSDGLIYRQWPEGDGMQMRFANAAYVNDLERLLYSQRHSGIGMDDTDTLDAMRLLQEMRTSEEFCCINLSSDYAFVWDISYVHSGPPDSWTNENHDERKVFGSFDRLSDAIRAFYRLWKEGKLEDNDETLERK